MEFLHTASKTWHLVLLSLGSLGCWVKAQVHKVRFWCSFQLGTIGGSNDFKIAKQELLVLDGEGRCVITDHQLFVLFNVYFPCGSEDRADFKLAFSQAIQDRVYSLLKMDRNVILVGDVNVCHQPIDHCDPDRSVKDNEIDSFQDTPCRRWFDEFLWPKGGRFVGCCSSENE